jgi:hypothetical protein
MREQLKWYDDKAYNSPWLDALAELRQRAAREGYCFQHVQAITVNRVTDVFEPSPDRQLDVGLQVARYDYFRHH